MSIHLEFRSGAHDTSVEHTALSDVHTGREIFRIFSNLFASEIDQSDTAWMEHRHRGLGDPCCARRSPFTCRIVGRSRNPEGRTRGRGSILGAQGSGYN